MPGPMRRMARTAAVAGTAAHVARGRQESKDAAAAEAQAQAQAPAPVEQAPVAPAPAAPAAASMDDKMSQLERLGALKEQGILSEEEFEQQKATILAG